MIRNERFSNIIYIFSLRMKTRDRSLGNALFLEFPSLISCLILLFPAAPQFENAGSNAKYPAHVANTTPEAF